MIVSNIASARAIWLFDIADLNPRGHHIYDRLFKWLVTRYRFSKFPANASDLDESKGWSFLNGQFVIGDEAIEVTLKVFTDGIVGETRRSTDASEAFLTDVMTTAAQEFALPFTLSMIHRRIYGSDLNLVVEQRLNSLHPQLQAFSNALSEASDTTCELMAISFGADVAQPILRFERKAGTPFSQNRYWSTATVPTHVHLELLNRLETLLTT